MGRVYPNQKSYDRQEGGLGTGPQEAGSPRLGPYAFVSIGT